jgi:hypothetical protein
MAPPEAMLFTADRFVENFESMIRKILQIIHVRSCFEAEMKA